MSVFFVLQPDMADISYWDFCFPGGISLCVRWRTDLPRPPTVGQERRTAEAECITFTHILFRAMRAKGLNFSYSPA